MFPAPISQCSNITGEGMPILAEDSREPACVRGQVFTLEDVTR